MSYTENHLIRTCECDMYGRWKPSAMLEAMQEVAVVHCESVGLGRKTMDAQGVAWVLSRCRVELNRHPVSGETITLETFALPTRHLFFPRGHVLRDVNGNRLGGAMGMWVLMDLAARKIVPSPFVTERLPVEDREAPAAIPGTVRPLNDRPTASELCPQFTEFDMNAHVNNAKYLDWCWNALGFDALRGRQIASFDVNYDREILRGESIHTELCRDDDAFTFCGSADGRRCFGIGGRFREPQSR